jgi:hypothetical protein
MKHIHRTIFVLSLMLVASTCYALRLELTNDYGAALTADCVEPCTDYYIHSIIECRHLNEAGCEIDQCAINSLRYLKCTVPTGGSGEELCDWTTDPNDWGRWVVAREMPCPKPHNAYTHTYGACEGSPYPGEFTPCVASQCYGTLRRDSADEMNRPICN